MTVATNVEEPVRETATTAPVVTLESVSKVFNNEYAVADLNFQIPYGKIIGLIGPSGCGKTTTVRLMTGIYDPSDGDVKVFGKDPRRFTSREREHIGYMTQNFTLFPDLTVKENMNFAAALYGRGILKRGKPINALLDFVELSGARNKLTSKISGGMQRRLLLAATLIHNPSLLFLDEPTAGIDPILRRKFWDQFIQLRDQGRTLVITTQYVNEASYCDLVGIMSDGRLIMLEEPETLVRKAFGGEMLDLIPKVPIPYQQQMELNSLSCMSKPLNVRPDGKMWLVVDDVGRALPEIMGWLNERNIEIESLDPYNPPYDDVFVKVVKDYQDSIQVADGIENERGIE